MGILASSIGRCNFFLEGIRNLFIAVSSIQSVAFIRKSLCLSLVVASPRVGFGVMRKGAVSLTFGVVPAPAILCKFLQFAILIIEPSGVIAFISKVALDEPFGIGGSVKGGQVSKLGALVGIGVSGSHLAKVFIVEVLAEESSVFLGVHLRAGVVKAEQVVQAVGAVNAEASFGLLFLASKAIAEGPDPAFLGDVAVSSFFLS